MDDVSETAITQTTAVRLSHLQVRNFRCFEQFEVQIQSPYIVFAGANGVGKTSLLEALYYACYLRSFRTHSPKELIHFGKHEFFVKVTLDTLAHHIPHAIQIGFSAQKRLVKIDQKPISSYKELMTYYRVVSITESDLELIQGSPNHRRLFLDQILLFLDAAYATTLKTYHQVIDQRNALLQQRSFNEQTYIILTEQVWLLAKTIQEQRMSLLEELAVLVTARSRTLLQSFSSMEFFYVPKRSLGVSYSEFMEREQGIMHQEQRFGRTLFGAHLDDITIIFQGQSSRLYASRGQQKLMLMLIKMAQLELLLQRGIPAICLLDDFMTDFDQDRITAVLQALQGLGTQLIFTTPLERTPMTEHLATLDAQTVKLTA